MATPTLTSELTGDDMKALIQQITTLKNDVKELKKKHKNGMKKMRKEIVNIQKANQKKEETQKFLFTLKDLSAYKRLVETIQKNISLDSFQKKIIRRHEEEFSGIEKQRKSGIEEYFEVKNGVGHSDLTAASVAECLSILQKYQDMPAYFGVNCTNEETIQFLNSCAGCFESVLAYVKSQMQDRK